MLIVGSQESWKCSCVDDERPNANRAGPMNMPETKKVSCAEAKSRHIQGSVAQGKKFGKLLNQMECVHQLYISVSKPLSFSLLQYLYAA